MGGSNPAVHRSRANLCNRDIAEVCTEAEFHLELTRHSWEWDALIRVMIIEKPLDDSDDSHYQLSGVSTCGKHMFWDYLTILGRNKHSWNVLEKCRPRSTLRQIEFVAGTRSSVLNILPGTSGSCSPRELLGAS